VQNIPEIVSIKLFRTKFVPLVQEAIQNPSDREIIQEGLKFREASGLSFWDSILLHVSTHDRPADTFLKLAMRHNSQNLDFTEVTRADSNEATFRALISELRGDQILAISSAVKTNKQKVRHLPLIDFHCKESTINLNTVKMIVAELGLSGFIIKSGGSYHFYGKALVDEEMLANILARALLFAPIVDHRWVAHQMIERACGLRMSPGKQYWWCPQVVAEV
jgi:hypothetical protein